VRSLSLLSILVMALWCGGCVQGPLVKVGSSDKPLVDVKINQGRDGSSAANKKDEKAPDRTPGPEAR